MNTAQIKEAWDAEVVRTKTKNFLHKAKAKFPFKKKEVPKPEMQEVPDNVKEAFVRGFMKAAEQAAGLQGTGDDIGSIILANIAARGLQSGLIGGGIGATTGYLANMAKKDPAKDHRYRDAALGGILGAGIGGGLGVAQPVKQYTDYVAHPFDSFVDGVHSLKRLWQ